MKTSKIDQGIPQKKKNWLAWKKPKNKLDEILYFKYGKFWSVREVIISSMKSYFWIMYYWEIGIILRLLLKINYSILV